MFTKQHYKAIADITNKFANDILPYAEYGDEYAYSAVANLIKELADYFEKDNDLFNREKFLKACRIYC